MKSKLPEVLMNHFEYRNGEMFAEDVPVKRAKKWARRLMFSLATLKRRVFDQAFAKFHISSVFPSRPIPT